MSRLPDGVAADDEMHEHLVGRGPASVTSLPSHAKHPADLTWWYSSTSDTARHYQLIVANFVGCAAGPCHD